ncbi:MAG: Ribosomal protein [Herbinix sp.]|jgi:DNA-directed RNA polymerase subunit RPC12/RpoP|nr:Ribosomal protein [Herbinix sp.]
MPIVQAKCTNCGGKLHVDSAKEAAICPYCGSAYIVEKAVQHFQVTNNNTFNGATIIQEDGFKKLIEAAEGYVRLGDLKSAKSTYERISKEYPQKGEGWLGLVKLEIDKEKKKFDLNLNYGSASIDNVRKIGTPNQINELEALLNVLHQEYERRKETFNETVRSKFRSLNDLHDYLNKKNIGLKDQDIKIFVNKNRVIIHYHPHLSNERVEREIVDYNPENGSLVLSDKLRSRYIGGGAKPSDAYYQYHQPYPFRGTIKITEIKDNNILLSKEDLTQNSDWDRNNAWYNEYVLKPYATNPENKSAGCYIASCIYGSYNCPAVWTLRRYRDYYLSNFLWGRCFIKIYYIISPKVVLLFGKTKWFHNFWRSILDRKIYKLKEKGYQDTPYKDQCH